LVEDAEEVEDGGVEVADASSLVFLLGWGDEVSVSERLRVLERDPDDLVVLGVLGDDESICERSKQVRLT